jgi:hypothetical protein
MTQAKPKTYAADLAHLPEALLPLTEHKRWVVWPWELRTTKGGKEKWTKPPRQARDPSRNARSNDPATWGSYSDALAAVSAGNADGIGYMLKDSDIGAIDLDHCVDRESSKPEPWAEQLCSEANGAYHEITVSGTGMRIIGKVGGPELHRRFAFDRNGAGIELYRNTARFITVSGLQLGDCTELPPLDAFIDTLFARHSGQAAGGFDFNAAGAQSSSLDYDDLIENGAPEGGRSELFQAVVWHLAGKGWGADQITDELARHPGGIGAKYANRLHAEVTRSYKKWASQKRAATTGSAAPSNNPWPQIYVRNGELPRIVNEAEDALLLLGREIYQRGGLVVRPVLSKLKAADDRETSGWRLIPVTRPWLVESFTCAARFLKHDRRAKDWVAVDAPDKVADVYLARAGAWKLPILTGITNTPFLRSDGSICERPGYDETSGLIFKPDGETFPPIPPQPSKRDAKAALETLMRLLADFPFVGKADKSVALSGILTALDRRSLPTAPMHGFTSPTAGTGKSLLVDIISMLSAGKLMPVVNQGRSEEELEKRLGAALLAGDAAISIDNCDHPLASGFLCQALTQQQLNIRLLGASKHVETPTNAALFATGNNLVVIGDLVRRTLLCSLDAQCERPELRTFETNVIETIRASRGQLVTAALTILRAWLVSGERMTVTPFGSFECWSRRIREVLIWLGQEDPCNTVTKVRAADPAREALLAVVTQWKQHLGVQLAYTAQEVINRATVDNDFHVALLNVAVGKSGGNVVSNKRLGWWLKNVEGKVVSVIDDQIRTDLVVRKEGITAGYPKWRLYEIRASGGFW